MAPAPTVWVSMLPDGPGSCVTLPPPLVPSTACCLLFVANLWITSGSYPEPTYSNEFVFLKPSQFEIFKLLILPSSQQSANLSFSITFNMHFYLYHCNQFPALHSFFCKYLAQFLFLCLAADWWIEIEIISLVFWQGNRGSVLTDLPSLKIGNSGTWG